VQLTKRKIHRFEKLCDQAAYITDMKLFLNIENLSILNSNNSLQGPLASFSIFLFEMQALN
jgi:hypothetical protein